jgi:hypothetical protein
MRTIKFSTLNANIKLLFFKFNNKVTSPLKLNIYSPNRNKTKKVVVVEFYQQDKYGIIIFIPTISLLLLLRLFFPLNHQK